MTMTSQSDRKHGRWARRIQLAAIFGEARRSCLTGHRLRPAEPANTAAAAPTRPTTGLGAGSVVTGDCNRSAQARRELHDNVW